MVDDVLPQKTRLLRTSYVASLSKSMSLAMEEFYRWGWMQHKGGGEVGDGLKSSLVASDPGAIHQSLLQANCFVEF